MTDDQVRLRRSAGRLAVFAAVLLALPAVAAAQESQAQTMSAVADQHSLENLLPTMTSSEIGSIKDIAAWCLDMAATFKGRLSDASKQIDLQRAAKRAEIKALEARAKAAGKTKDDAEKTQLTLQVRTQKLELDILDAVKELTAQEAAAANDFEAASKSLRDLVSAFRDLGDNREKAVRNHEKAVEEATAAGLAAPLMPGPDYPANEKPYRMMNDAGKNVNDLGERLMKVAKARQGVLSAWGKLEGSKTGK
jgi:hypothetical protein